MAADCQTVIIDNTNIRGWEMKPYVELAALFQYHVKIEIAKEWDVEVCASRNTHGVPREAIARMKAAFEPDHTAETILQSSPPKR
jgi:predicted kinase